MSLAISLAQRGVCVTARIFNARGSAKSKSSFMAASQVVHTATIDQAKVAGSMFTIRETSYGDVTPASMDQDEPT